jgi:ferritin-like metal-binding protein YciE
MNKPVELTQQQKDNIEKVWFLTPEQKKQLATAIKNNSYKIREKTKRILEVYVRTNPGDASLITEEVKIACYVFSIPMEIKDDVIYAPKEDLEYIRDVY